MKKKGFTLVELLAVIVILAIIALIATPIILNVIDEAKKGAVENSALGYIDALEKQIASDLVKNGTTTITNGTHGVSELKSVTVKGYKPSSGEVVIENSYVKTAKLCINDYNVEYDGTKVTVIDSPCDGDNGKNYICKRATTLHTEECTQTSNYCYAAGYTASGSKKTTTITYGNLGTSGAEPVSGDAFDCDVDGTGYNHRFYYVTEFTSDDKEYAVLIYYNNTTEGVADNTAGSLIAYDSSNKNYQGPVTAITNLPTTKEWSNISLSNTSRAIITQTGTTSAGGGPLPTAFSYTKTVNGETVPLAARLLTYQEIAMACGGDGNPTSTGELDGCNYLLENTKYSNSSMRTYGYWLETPDVTYSNFAWYVYGFRYVRSVATSSSHPGVRPAIEVLKSEISY